MCWTGGSRRYQRIGDRRAVADIDYLSGPAEYDGEGRERVRDRFDHLVQ